MKIYHFIRNKRDMNSSEVEQTFIPISFSLGPSEGGEEILKKIAEDPEVKQISQSLQVTIYEKLIQELLRIK